MKNFILILFLLFWSNHFYAQLNSGVVNYASIRNQIDENESDDTPYKFKEAKGKIEKAINDLEFVLKFNKESSLFSIREDLSIDLNEHFTNMALLFTRGNRIFYTNLIETYILEQTSLAGEYFLIKSSTEDLQWKLTKEKKLISGYLCYKAYSNFEFENHLKKKIQFNYIAWYCPEIPFNFGPFEISNLPGLVLEFSNNKTTYIANSINLSKEPIKLDVPDKGKIVTKEDYENIGKKVYNNMNEN